MEIDFRSETWKAIKARTEDRLSAARKRNDGALTPDQTATLRGTIAAYKEILALETAPEIGTDE